MIHIGGNQTISSSLFWLNEGCNEYRHSPFLPNIAKTGLKSSTTCKYWINGYCMFGDQCRYLHSRSNGRNLCRHTKGILFTLLI